jgi:hypothetical protein
VTIAFERMPQSRIAELAAHFDILLGWTPSS